ncbi:hypothetical protein Cgig2_030320 [Carnegiea gigantea]|uniref:Uncharacterized protein n=1 Tax=Carnegiea gigantea TaxID=171969 RepID=A0A9Q1JX57_9CARY|nr:hypothetical protein Cgig2_030320 [Carnegiea gigantea]
MLKREFFGLKQAANLEWKKMGKQKSLTKKKAKEDRLLAIYYEGHMFVIFNMDLDKYQMIDLHRDAYIEGKKCGLNVPEYFGIWEYDGGKILIYILALSTPTMYHFIVQQLQPSQVAPTMQPVEHPLSSIHYDLKYAQPESQLPELTIDLSAYLSSQLKSTSQLDLPSLDAINVGLGGLEAYDLRDLRQPRGASDYDYDGEFWEDNLGRIDDLMTTSEKEECNESLVDLNENGSNDESDADEILNIDLDDEIPRHIDADAEDEDGNPTENMRNKILQENKMASHPWIVEQLMIDFKANPTMQASNI